MALFTSRILLLVLSLIVSKHIVQAGESGDSIAPAARPKLPPRLPLTVDVISNIRRPGALLFSLEVTDSFVMNYTLKCVALDTVYRVTAVMSVRSVVEIVSNNSFGISCLEAKPFELFNATSSTTAELYQNGSALTAEDYIETGENVSYVGYVQGKINMTVSTYNIGRSFLLLMADDVNNPMHPQSFDGASQTTEGSAAFSERPNSSIGSTDNHHQGHGHRTESAANQLPPNVVGRAIVMVMQLPRTIDKVFRILLYIVIILATIGMGVSVELAVVKAVLRRPVAPLIGLGCQYICMPLLAYVIAHAIPQDNPAVSLGIFLCGVVPGGGMSNMFTFLLGGDLSLSVTMTVISNVAGLAFIPMWIFILGDSFKDDITEFKIPYLNILETLAVAILPIFLGIIIKHKVPKLTKVIMKVLKPVLLVVVAFVISLGIYTNLFIFRLIKPMTIAAGCLLPYLGYVVGGLVSLVLCQSWCRVKTIAIETGIQNTGIAFLIVFLSLPPPDNQLAAVGPASSAIMTPLPLFGLVLCYIIYQRCRARGQQPATDEEGGADQLKPGNVSDQEVAKLASESITGKNGVKVKALPWSKMRTSKGDKERNLKKKESEKVKALKAIAQGQGTAAIVVLWSKLTRQPQPVPVDMMFKNDITVAPPEEDRLVNERRPEDGH
ncbi:unnamed protein product [Lymnaea stagnalis]|uniref:Ileal sodium/bile acid cotransporter n=1 Tax=Lymnaea stagnalis TaxID=6523 RepID=A0AAV2I2A0_LYMST